MAVWAAALIGSGTSKCGWPMLKFTGSLRLRASSKTLRMPEDSMWRMRLAIQCSCMAVGPAFGWGHKKRKTAHTHLLRQAARRAHSIRLDWIPFHLSQARRLLSWVTTDVLGPARQRHGATAARRRRSCQEPGACAYRSDASVR